jgi:hypothetical protein
MKVEEGRKEVKKKVEWRIEEDRDRGRKVGLKDEGKENWEQ